MKLPPMNLNELRWDVYRRFHKYHGDHFVQFETGELMSVKSRWEPHDRRTFHDLNVAVYLHTDTDCPVMIDPKTGNTIPKSWLDHGGAQLLLIDLDTKRVVRVGDPMRADTHPQVPCWLTDKPYPQCRVYFPGPGAPPVGRPVTVNETIRPTSEQREHVRNLQTAAKMWLEMTHRPQLGDKRLTWNTNPVKWPRLLECKTFTDLTVEERVTLCMVGVMTWTNLTTRPYLLINR